MGSDAKAASSELGVFAQWLVWNEPVASGVRGKRSRPPTPQHPSGRSRMT